MQEHKFLKTLSLPLPNSFVIYPFIFVNSSNLFIYNMKGDLLHQIEGEFELAENIEKGTNEFLQVIFYNKKEIMYMHFEAENRTKENNDDLHSEIIYNLRITKELHNIDNIKKLIFKNKEKIYSTNDKIHANENLCIEGNNFYVNKNFLYVFTKDHLFRYDNLKEPKKEIFELPTNLKNTENSFYGYPIDQRFFLVNKDHFILVDFKNNKKYKNQIHMNDCKYTIKKYENLLIISNNKYDDILYFDINKEEFEIIDEEYNLKLEINDSFDTLNIENISVCNNYIYLINKESIEGFADRKENEIEIVYNLNIEINNFKLLDSDNNVNINKNCFETPIRLIKPSQNIKSLNSIKKEISEFDILKDYGNKNETENNCYNKFLDNNLFKDLANENNPIKSNSDKRHLNDSMNFNITDDNLTKNNSNNEFLYDLKNISNNTVEDDLFCDLSNIKNNLGDKNDNFKNENLKIEDLESVNFDIEDTKTENKSLDIFCNKNEFNNPEKNSNNEMKTDKVFCENRLNENIENKNYTTKTFSDFLNSKNNNLSSFNINNNIKDKNLCSQNSDNEDYSSFNKFESKEKLSEISFKIHDKNIDNFIEKSEYEILIKNLSEETNDLISKFKNLKTNKLNIKTFDFKKENDLNLLLQTFYNKMLDYKNKNKEKEMEYKLDLIIFYLERMKRNNFKESLCYIDSFIRNIKGKNIFVPFRFYDELNEGIEKLKIEEKEDCKMKKMFFDFEIEIEKLSIGNNERNEAYDQKIKNFDLSVNDNQKEIFNNKNLEKKKEKEVYFKDNFTFGEENDKNLGKIRENEIHTKDNLNLKEENNKNFEIFTEDNSNFKEKTDKNFETIKTNENHAIDNTNNFLYTNDPFVKKRDENKLNKLILNNFNDHKNNNLNNQFTFMQKNNFNDQNNKCTFEQTYKNNSDSFMQNNNACNPFTMKIEESSNPFLKPVENPFFFSNQNITPIKNNTNQEEKKEGSALSKFARNINKFTQN
ncbi:hypothetical protein GVAV_000893 [Gurleya vavrai]